MKFKGYLILFVCVFVIFNITSYGQVYINEIIADNETILTDGEGEYKDWIELYNTSNTAINLQGWYLTDNSSDLTKWTFPAVTIGANSYLIVWASGKHPTSLNNGLHTDFSLESNGEYLALVMPDGLTIANDFIYTNLPEDISYGIFSGSDGEYNNDGNFIPLATPTPTSANTNALEAPVAFSVDGRFFNSSFTVALSTTVPGGTIHYTTNGSTPTTSSATYNSPITINSTTQLKAIVVYSGGGTSPVKIERYVKIANNIASADSDLPIILIESYGDTIIRDAQTTAFASIIEPDASGRAQTTDAPTYSGPIGIRVRGSSSSNFAKKQFKVETWDENNEEINVEILDMPAESDWVLYAPGRFDRVLISNPFMYELSRKMGYYAPRTQFVEVYLNQNGGNINANDYVGLYIWTESIKRDNDRVDVKKLESTDNNSPEVTGGYMFRIDRDETWMTANGQNIVENEPGADATTAQQTYLRNYIQDYENALYSGNWLDPNTGYKNYINLESWVFEHTMRILAKDPDGLRLSSYYYKDREEPINAGPIWDFDRTLNSDDSRDDVANEWFYNVGNNRVDFFEFSWWSRMTEDPDWRVEWHDNWFTQRREGCFQTNVINNLIDSLVAIIQEAEARDEARWAGVNGYGYRYDATLAGEVQALKNWLNTRMNWIDSQLIPNPGFSLAEGVVSPGTSVTLSNTYGAGTIYYTTDGTDPRLPGGGFSPSAIQYTGPIPINSVTAISARIYVNGNWGNQIQSPWGAICTQRYQLPQDYSDIIINEIMYHPGLACGAFTPELDYIEITNAGNTTIDMSFAEFTNGVQFTFPFGSSLAPNQFYIIAEDKTIFDANYSATADGQYTGTLSNKGDSLVLKDIQNNIIDLVDFNDKSPWDEAPDGDGPSLELLDPSLDNNDAISWFRSDNACGTPGVANSRLCNVAATPIVINEINYNPSISPNTGDWVELYNPNASAVNISNWEFYDGENQFIIPSGTTLQADEYLILTEDAAAFSASFPHLNANQTIGDLGFNLSNGGERISLFNQNKCLSDYVSYNDKSPWDTIPDGNGPTLSLITPNSDNALPQSWESSSNINSAYGTPGRENTPCVENSVILPNLICAGFPIPVKIDSVYSDMTFTWLLVGATPDNFVTNSDTIIWNTPGTYNIQLITKHYECTKIYTQSVTVEDCNTIPNIVDDNFAINEDNVLSDNVLTNDSDPDNDNLTVNTIPRSNVSNGTLILNPDGTYDYTPNANFYGMDSFIYEVCDDATFGITTTTSGSFSGQVTASGDDLEELTTGTIEVNSSDLDIMEDSPDFYSAIGIRITNITVPQGANVTGAYLEFVADEAQSVATSLTISAEATGNAAAIPTTANALTSKTKTNATSSWSNLPAWVIGNTYQSADISPVIQELINRGDWATGNAMTFIIEGTGRRTAESFDGTAPPKLVINYEVISSGGQVDVSLCNTAVAMINIASVNDAPITVNDVATMIEDMSFNGNVAINDNDVEGDNLTVNITPISGVSNGTLILNSNGTYSYIPNSNFFGTDSFIYEICDDGNPNLCTQATVNITVNSINDAPLLQNDFLQIQEDAVLSGNVLTNAGDVENHTLSVTTSPVTNTGNGTIILNANGTYTYTPYTNFFGVDSFVYEVCDNGTPVACSTASVTINIVKENDAPIAVNDTETATEDISLNGNIATNDSDVEGDNLTVNTMPITLTQNGALSLLVTGSYTYTPNVDFYGTDTFEYEICDDGSPILCDTASVTIDVMPVNDAPIPLPDTLSMFANSSIQDNVLLNDSDIENDGLITMTTPVVSPSNGTLIIQSNGNIDYTPNSNFVGTDSFTYEVCDSGTPIMCDTETVTIIIEPDCINIELAAWLEGAYISTLGEMRNTLAATRKLLPGQTPASNLASPTPAGQPYSAAPWNYAGTEGAAWTDANYTGDETDWVLVSFRTGIAKNTEVGMTAALLMKDGNITFPDRCALTSTVASPLYIVVEHRNHIGIMTPQPVDVIGSTLTYDFRVADSYRDPTSFGQKQISTGEWTMYAGDADQSDFPSFDIQGTDKTIWFDNNGIFDYYFSPDFNLDGDINGQDKSLWFENNGISSRVPK